MLLILGFVLVLVVAGGALLFLRRRRASAKPAPPRKAPARPSGKKSPDQPKEMRRPPPPAVSTPPPAAASPPPAPARPLPIAAPGDKIRILVVDDNPDTRGHVSRLLYFEEGMDVIGQARNGREGIDMAKELKPHIVLMDINMPDMDGITATQQMSIQAPFSQVIIMSVQAEQHYMKQAMAAGARDFQPKPFTADELISCVRRVYKIGLPAYRQFEVVAQLETQAAQTATLVEQTEGDVPVIVVYSPKGGIGTSTLAVNLAIALQRAQGDVVLMDADLQFGDILVHLNTRPTRTMMDLIHDGQLDLELLPEVLLPHNSGLKLLLAPPQPELADAITPPMIGELIKALQRNFKAVVIDTHSKLDDRTIAVLDEADFILTLTAPELPAIKSAKQFLELAQVLEFDPKRLGIVINRANQPGGIPPAKIQQILKLEHAYEVAYDPRMSLAINKGVALTLQDPTAPSAQAIIQLANEVWDRLAATHNGVVTEAA
ncbi:MAG: response regulator [Chloroflexota bacterium]